MMSEKRIVIITLSLSITLLLFSLGWWWLVFGNVVENGYITAAQAATCLAAETDLCRLAQALCSNEHFFEIRGYAPETLWAAAALALVALAQTSFRPNTQ